MANNTKPSQKTGKSRKGLWIVLATVTAITLIAGLVIYLVLSFGNVGEQKKMESYLKEKYGKEFVVSNVRTEGATIGIPGQQTGDAYPADDNNLTFEVGHESNNQFYDKYPGAVWAKQESEPVRQFLATVFEQMPEWRVELNLYTPKRKTIKTVPDFKTAQEQYRNDILYAITVKMNGDLTSSNRLDHQTKAFKIIEYLKSKNIDYPLMRYVISIDNQDAEYVCNLSDKDLEKIQSPNDLNNCFKRLEGKE